MSLKQNKLICFFILNIIEPTIKESNFSIIEKNSPKEESLSDFIAISAMSVVFDTYFDL